MRQDALPQTLLSSQTCCARNERAVDAGVGEGSKETAMPTRKFERIALMQILVAGCAVLFGLIELAQAQPEYEQPLVHHHRGRDTGLAWPYYCGSSPCVRIHPRGFYGYAAPY